MYSLFARQTVPGARTDHAHDQPVTTEGPAHP